MKKEIIEKAYNELCNATPLKYDCGILCNSACCRNLSSSSSEKNEKGMLLLPGEEDFVLKDKKSFGKIIVQNNEKIYLCNGVCNRNYRPFACRIFPFYAEIESDSIKILPDERAFGICPLLDKRLSLRVNVYFLRNIRRSIRILMSESEIKDDIIKTGRFIKEIRELRKMFLANDKLNKIR